MKVSKEVSNLRCKHLFRSNISEIKLALQIGQRGKNQYFFKEITRIPNQNGKNSYVSVICDHIWKFVYQERALIKGSNIYLEPVVKAIINDLTWRILYKHSRSGFFAVILAML